MNWSKRGATLAVALSVGLFHGGAARAATAVPGGNVSGTWTLAGSPYVVTAPITATPALVIEKGVQVLFDAGTVLQVTGTLTVNGEAAEPVLFTVNSGSPSRGSWFGIRVEDGGSASLSYATISYGGMNWGSTSTSNLYKTGSGTLALDHCTLTESGENGLQLGGASGGTTITASAFTNNGLRGLYASGGSPVTIGGTSAFSGNGECPIRVSAANSGIGVDETTTMDGEIWIDNGVITPASPLQWGNGVNGRYRLLGGVYLDSGTLHVAPGTTVTANNGTIIMVSGNLEAPGTAAHPIAFNGVSRGSWYGIRVEDGGSASLSYATISYGGMNWGGTSTSNLYKTGSAALVLDHCTLTESGENGLQLGGASGGTTITASAFTNNGLRGLYAYGGSPATIGGSSVFSGNGECPIRVSAANSGIGVDETTTMDGEIWIDDGHIAPAIPLQWGNGVNGAYRLLGGVHVDSGTLHVAAGTTVKANSGTIIKVSGNLEAPGTGTHPIAFNGATRGSWFGIRVEDGGSASLSYATISYGGMNWGSTSTSNLYKTGSGALVLDHCTLTESGENGLQLGGASGGTTISASVFTNNGLRGLYAYGGSPATISGSSAFSGNGESPIRVSAANSGIGVDETTTMDGEIWIEDGHITPASPLQWGNGVNGSYRLLGGVYVDSGTLHVAPGTTVKANNGTIIMVSGNLEAPGTSAHPIAFNGATRGSWYGIRVEDGGSASLSYATISYGGMNWGSTSTSNLYKTGSGTLALDHCTLTESGENGLQLAGASGGTTITASAFTNNGLRGIYASGGSPVTIGGTSAFSGNGECPIRVSAANSGIGVDETTTMDGEIWIDDGHITPASPLQWGNGVNGSYRLLGGVYVDSGTLHVAPGTTVKANSGTIIMVSGRLEAPGTSAHPIAFNGATRGSWFGIRVEDGGSASLSYATIGYGGMNSGNTSTSNLYKTGSGALVLDHCTLTESGENGLQLGGASGGTTVTASVFTNNGLRGLYAYGGSPAAISGSSAFSGNGECPIRVSAPDSGIGVDETTTMDGEIWVDGGHITPASPLQWGNGVNGSYRLIGGFYVDSGTLHVAPGTTVTANNGTIIMVSGNLEAPGTGAHPIVFAGAAPGSWFGIRVEDGGSASLSHATISHGGMVWGGSASDLYKTGSGTLALDHCTLDRSSSFGLQLAGATGGVNVSASVFSGNGYGIYAHTSAPLSIATSDVHDNTTAGIAFVGAGSPVTLSRNTVHGNPVGVLCSSSANPIIGGTGAAGNDIYGNSLFGVQNTDAAVSVNARNNWWGAASGPYHATNPDGAGNPVSDYVDFGAWFGVSTGSGEPNIVAAPVSADFGNAVPGSVLARTFTVLNNGPAPLQVGTLSVSDEAEFSLENDLCSEQSLEAMEDCTFDVVFLRTSAGPKVAEAQIPNNDPDPESSPVVIPLSGFGIECAAPLAGLVSWWRAEGDATDYVGANDGSLAGDAGYATGFVGAGFSFAGAGDGVVVPDSDALDLSTSWTLSAWVRPATVPEYPNGSGIISKAGIAGGYSYQMTLTRYGGAPTIWCGFTSDGGWPAYTVTGGTVPIDSWTHVACVYDHSALRVYVNGVEANAAGVGEVTTWPSTSSLRISGDDNANSWFDGGIDEPQIYGRALVPAELASLAGAATCVGPYAVITPDAHDFGEVNAGTTSAPAGFELRNAGLRDLVVSDIAPSGGDETRFAAIAGGTCATLAPTLAPGESCTFTAEFSPLDAGAHATSLRVSSNDANTSPLDAALTGTGVYTLQLEISPPGSGWVSGPGFTCGPTCAPTFDAPEPALQLTASPSSGYTFLRWEGDLTGNANPGTLAVTTHRSVTAVFATTITVCPSGCDEATIAAAIAAARPGDTILISPGTYKENLVVAGGSEFTLRGGGAKPAQTVISGDRTAAADDGSVLAVTANDGETVQMSVENLTLASGSNPGCGGGLRLEAAGTGSIQAHLTRVVLRLNRAGVALSAPGGGICALATSGGNVDLALENAMVTENSAATGGGVYALADGGTIGIGLMNATFASNAAATWSGLRWASSGAGALDATLTNSIVYGNWSTSGGETTFTAEGGGQTVVAAAYSDMKPPAVGAGVTYTTVGGMLNASPVYVNQAKGDFHLHGDSPCINRGTGTGAPLLDWEGTARPQGVKQDVGADEYAKVSYPRLRLLTLTGGESVRGGKPYDITWGAPATQTRFKVWVSLDGGKKWTLKATKTGVARHYTWTPPRPPKNVTTYRVKVEGYLRSGALAATVKSARNFTVKR